MKHAMIAVTLVAAACVGSLAAAPALAEHDHAAAEAALQLDNGKKWKTDAPLRKGMTDIRRRIQNMPKTANEGAVLAKGIEGDIAYMVENCKLAPKADATLHVILSQITEGTHVLGKAGAGEREQGMHRVQEALHTYEKYFDHPGWTEAK
jgi:hypothetical protein